jgi:hypothetical protein
MVKNGTGGAITSFSASGLAVATGHAILNRGFLDAALTEDVGQIGAAAFLAKVYLFRTTDNYRDLLDTFTLLGDPGVVLAAGRG